ncbi:MAG: CHASE3 domain-containing protein [Flavobacterium sp.]|nr:CHASE3 domain-containing protein [Flavobacterium sp.]
MTIRNSKFSSLFLSITLVIAIFTLFFLVSNSFQQIQTLNESEKLVQHSQKIHLELEQLISYVKDAETGQRGYILTHDTVFLKPYSGAYEKVKLSLKTLQKLTSDNLQQQKNIVFVNRLIDEEFLMLDTTLKQNSFNIKTSSSLRTQLVKSKNIMEILRARVNKMITIETQLLKKREEGHRNQINFSPISFLLTAVFSLLVFIGAFYKINKDVKSLKLKNNQLLINKEIFEHSEQIAEISNWCWNIEANHITYSNNQYRLLGYEPHEFEPTIEKFLEFVHPDDRHIVQEGGKKVLTENTGSIAYFRVIRKDGELRYFKSIGKMIVDNFDKRILIGVNADITEQFLKDKILEEKLFDLERSNKELSAFNHVASHDLQEPLRKVQTLISIIKEKDYDSLSEKTKEYFTRIQVAANRMQKLIDDLLLFSRANKADKIFEMSDLNEILENSKLDLAEIIESKKATIQCLLLPTINVIPFQIQQLFINMIGNSLKYSQTNIPPEINISSEIIQGKNLPKSWKLGADKKFYKITIKDNGIGFEQQYAKTIFTLFQRLHDNNEYSGTGIGLAICKKIVENHKGFITAEGKPNLGCAFTVYLPA